MSNTGISANNFFEAEIEELEKRVESAILPKNLKEKMVGLLSRLKKMTMVGGYSTEFEPLSSYISWVLQIPFGNVTSDNLDLENTRKELQEHHYGLQPVKDRLLEYLAVIKLKQGNNEVADVFDPNMSDDLDESMKKLQGNSANAPVLCFVGIQGVGKTTMAKSIAQALGRGFVRIALGGLGGITELRGRARGESDSEPGQIVKSLIRTRSMNPVILLDEIDKVSSDSGLRADVMASLLEILDPEQNSAFMDKYLDYPLNLSQCIFITTANNLGGISSALLDRMEVIRFGSYNDNDKIQIAKNYLLPKVRKATGLGENQLSFTDDVWIMVIRPLGFDAGVRQLERTLMDLARKVALQIVKGEVSSVVVNPDNFRQYIPEQIGVFS